MSNYEGGYTSAVNSQSARESQDAQRQALMQQIAQAAQAFQQQQEQQKRKAAAQAMLPQLMASMGGGGGGAPQLPPPPQGGPQPPAPGAPSMPMMPPGGMGALPPPPGVGFASPPPGAGAAPPGKAPPSSNMGPPGGAGAPAGPVPWKSLPQPPEAAPAGPGGLPMPPGEGAVLPKTAVSVTDLAKSLAKQGIKGQDAFDLIEAWKPYMDSENKAELERMKVTNAAQTAALKAYAGVIRDAETKRHHGVLEAQGEKRLGQSQERININVNGSGDTDLAKDPETRRFMAEQYWAGDNSVMQNLGRGAQGAKNITALRKEIVAVGKEKGKTPKDLAAAQAEFQGMKAGERTLGTRTANIEMAAQEAKSLAELAIDASAKVPRTEYKSLNAVIQAAQKSTSSPELRAFVASNTSLINAYARAINPQGVGTVADKEHAREMLDTAFSKGDYSAAVNQLLKEIDAAQKSPRQVKDSMREGFTGKGDKGDYVELRTTADGKTLGKKADGTIEEVK